MRSSEAYASLLWVSCHTSNPGPVILIGSPQCSLAVEVAYASQQNTHVRVSSGRFSAAADQTTGLGWCADPRPAGALQGQWAPGKPAPAAPRQGPGWPTGRVATPPRAYRGPPLAITRLGWGTPRASRRRPCPRVHGDITEADVGFFGAALRRGGCREQGGTGL